MKDIQMPAIITDNGGRRRRRDRRFLVSIPFEGDRRTNWERRSGYDRRLRPIHRHPNNRRYGERDSSDAP